MPDWTISFLQTDWNEWSDRKCKNEIIWREVHFIQHGGKLQEKIPHFAIVFYQRGERKVVTVHSRTWWDLFRYAGKLENFSWSFILTNDSLGLLFARLELIKHRALDFYVFRSKISKKVKDALTTVGLTKYPERLWITKKGKTTLYESVLLRFSALSLCCRPFVSFYETAMHYVRVQRIASL